MGSRKRAREPAHAPPSDEEPAPKHRLVATASMRDAGFATLSQLLKDEAFCDVDITVEGRTFKAHRVVLAVGSGYFRTLFQSCMREAREKAFSIDDVSAAAFADCLTFLYGAKLDVTGASFAGVLQAASRLEITGLLESGAELMLSTLEPDSCVSHWETATALQRPELAHVIARCEEFATQHFTQVSEAEGFGRLALDRLRPLIESSKLWVLCETVVWRAVRVWLTESKEAESLDEAATLGLLRLVRYELIPAKFLMDNVQNALASTNGGKDLLLGAYRYHLQPPEARPAVERRKWIPVGVQLHVASRFLEGWTCHYDESYSHISAIEDVTSVPESATFLFMGAKSPEGTISLGAFGEVAKLKGFIENNTTERDELSTAKEENGCFWYFVSDCSMGFSRVPQVRLSAADTMGSSFAGQQNDEDGLYRLSWHTDGDDGGWRAGHLNDNDDDHSLDGWRKLIYFM